MRKSITILVLLFVLQTSLLAYTAQKIYPVNSDIYNQICDIYLMSGHAMPSSTGPWSTAELMKMINGISSSEIPDYLYQKYVDISNQLNRDLDDLSSDGISLEFGLTLTSEIYLHSTTDGEIRSDKNGVSEKLFVGRENWAYDLNHPSPFINPEFEIDIKDHSYIYFALPIQNGFHTGLGFSDEIGSTNFSSNIIGLQNMGNFELSLDPNSPYRAFIAFGGENWSLQIGRDRLSWGLGKTGNMVMSDNLPYHDMLRYSAFSNKFKFTFLISSFPHKSCFYLPSFKGSNDTSTDREKTAGINLYIAHRLESRLLNDKLSVTITEAIMYASDSGTMNLRALNPATVFHNLYIASDANSTLALEVDYTPIKGINLYVQAIVDEFAIPGETGASASSQDFPNGMGFLVGLKYSHRVGSGMINLNLEGAYVNPYTYLRYDTKNLGELDTQRYGLDYVVALRNYVSPALGTDSVVYDEYFLGYRYGNDCAIANFNLEWKHDSKLSLSTNLFFMAHGTHDKWTKWDEVGGKGEGQWKSNCVTPTTSHETENYRYDTSDRDAVCYTLDFGYHFAYKFCERTNLYVQMDFITIANPYNDKSLEKTSDLQVVIGVVYRF